ncbi:MAG: hypothetical protein ABI763_02865 [Bacteroidota bacterium]
MTISEATDLKPVKWKTMLFHSIFAVMLIMAWYFSKERLYTDSAYYFFHPLDSGFFVVAHQRLVLAISQVIFLSTYYLGASLKVLVISWSLSHILFYYSLFILVYHVHRNEAAGLAIILLQVVGQVWLYYSPMYEICYGGALLVVFYVLLDEKIFTPKRWFWLIVLEILVITSHPENFVIFFFVIISDIIRNGFLKKVHPVFFLIFIGTIIFKSLSFSDYEGDKLNFMLNLHENHRYLNLWNKNYMGDVLDVFTMHYKALLIFFLLALASLIMRKNRNQLLLFLFTALGLVALINATNDANYFSRYTESLYFPLTWIVTVSFLRDFYQPLGIQRKKLFFLLLIGVSLLQLNEVRKNGEFLKMRTFQMENIISASQQQGIKKGLVKLENTEKDRWAMNWSLPMESLVLSSLRNSSETVSVIGDEDFDYRDTTVALTQNRFILRRWEIRDDESMIPFFKVPHGNYIAMNTANSNLTVDYFSNHVKLETISSEMKTFGSKIFFPVKIINDREKSIPSLPVQSNYFEIGFEGDKDRQVIIPLDIDVANTYTEILPVETAGLQKPIHITVRLMVNGKEIASSIINVD